MNLVPSEQLLWMFCFSQLTDLHGLRILGASSVWRHLPLAWGTICRLHLSCHPPFLLWDQLAPKWSVYGCWGGVSRGQGSRARGAVTQGAMSLRYLAQALLEPVTALNMPQHLVENS